MAAKKKSSKKVVSKKSPKALKVSGVEDLTGLVPIDLGAGLKIAQETVKLTAKLAGHLDVIADAARGAQDHAEQTRETLGEINVGLGHVLPRILTALERIAAAQEKVAGIESPVVDVLEAAGLSSPRVVGHGEIENEDGSISQDFTREMAPAALPEAPAFNGHGDAPPV